MAVNRLWQWHFGEGLQKTPSDFGKLGGVPVNPPLLDWLAAEFVKRKFSMKEMHRLMVTSETYKLASEVDPAPWLRPTSKPIRAMRVSGTFDLQRLEAEPIWDSILAAAGTLDLAVGGPSFEVNAPSGRRGGGRGSAARASPAASRRAAYMVRGYSTSRDVVPNFLQAFDVDDGRAPCPLRTQTVTAPQALFLMNSEEIDKASCPVRRAAPKGIRRRSGRRGRPGLPHHACPAPLSTEKAHALTYLDNDPARLKGLAWLLFNLDEFVYVR